MILVAKFLKIGRLTAKIGETKLDLPDERTVMLFFSGKIG